MLSEVRQTTIVIDGNVQSVGFRGFIEELAVKYGLAGFVYNDSREDNVKFICEGKNSDITKLAEDVQKYPGVANVSFLDRVVLPKPVGRVVIGVEKDLFERLDIGVSSLGSIGATLESMDSTLKENTSLLGENTSILKENSSILKENTSILKENSSILKENTSISRENSSILKENTSISKENSSTLKGHTGLLEDIKEILQKIAEK